MNYSSIIREAWSIAVSSPQLKWFAFAPKLFAIIVFILEVLWQSYLYLEEFNFIQASFWKNIGLFWEFLWDKNLIGGAILIMFFVLIMVFIFPNIVWGTIIDGVGHRRKYKDRPFLLREKILAGLKNFFPLFEFGVVTGIFSATTVLLFTASLYRYYHDGFFDVFLPFIIAHVVISFFVWIFFSFAPFYIVCDEMGVSKAIRRSISTVFLNFGTTFLTILIMILINIRMILNAFIVFGVPFLLFFATTYFANWAILSIILLLGLITVILVAYLTSIVFVFSVALWEQVFQSIKKQGDLPSLESKDEA